MTSPTPPLARPSPARRPWLRWALLALIVTGLAGLYAWTRPPARTKLQFRHHWTGANATLASEVLDRFRTAHPEIDLQPIAVHNHWAKQYLLESVNHRSLPDVMIMSTGLVDLITQGNRLLPLEPLARATGDDLARLIPARELVGLSPAGALRALPLTARFSAATLLINLDVVERAGLATPALRVRTWSEFTTLSRQLVAALNPPGRLDVVAWNPLFDRGYPMVATLCYGRTPIMTADGRTSLLDQPAVRPAWLEIERYLQEVYGPYGGAAALLQWRHRHGGFSLTTIRTSFALGKVAFNFAGLPAIGSHLRANPTLRFASRPVPGLTGSVLLPVRHVACIGISQDCRDPAAAWQLVRYLTLTSEGNSPINLSAGTLGPVPALTDLPAYRRRYGPGWEEARQILPAPETAPIDFEGEWLDQFNLDFLSHRATGEPLDQTIQRMHQALQNWLDHRPRPGQP